MTTLSASLRKSIEEMIAMGKYPPGHPFDETELAKEFGVSRTPIREALIQLASMGLVEMRPRRGAVVAEVGPQQLVEMFEVMGELEAMCGRLAARRMSAEEQQKLQQAHLACQSACETRDSDTYYHQNEVFHQLIYSGSHNNFLAEQAGMLHRRLSPYRRLQLRVRDRIGASFQEHEAIVRAITAGDEERTATLLRQHIMVQGQRFADLIASLPSRSKAAA